MENNENIPDQIFGKFIEELKTSGVPDEEINRLTVWKDRGEINEATLRNALFSSEENI